MRAARGAGPLPDLRAAVAELVDGVGRLSFGAPVRYVYNPLVYARRGWESYLERFAGSRKEVLLVGMNPGPWGMAQTGVPFGAVDLVRDWMGIREPVGRPPREHPRRPVHGFACPRSEVSGQRLWGWARESFGTPERFFRRFLVLNHCPLLFLEASGRNLTPDRLPRAVRQPLLALCDRALARAVEALGPRWVVGIGRFAEQRARQALGGFEGTVGGILHPSPASPAANRGWAEQATMGLERLGIEL